MIKGLLAIVLMTFLHFSSAVAGDLRATPEVPGCDYLFSGTVKNGDADQIQNMIRPAAEGVTLCLDSPGGSYVEGIRMFYRIWYKDSIETRVLNGHSCMSACALAFQGGSRVIGTGLIRSKYASIEPGARLGFHAPTLALPEGNQYAPATVKSAYDMAIWGASQLFLMSRKEEHGARGMSDFLFARTLATPPHAMYEIDTIGKASLAEVAVRGVPIPEIGWRGIRNVCETALVMTDSRLSGMPNIAEAFKDFRDIGDDGTGRPIKLQDRVWSWSTELNLNFVVRGYPAPHKNERFCKVTLSRYAWKRELELPFHHRDMGSQWFTVSLWQDAYVPNARSFSQYAQSNTKIEEKVSVPWTALWHPMTPLAKFEQ